MGAPICKWCGTWPPEARVRVGDLEYHPKCATEFYEKALEKARAETDRAAATLREERAARALADSQLVEERQRFEAMRRDRDGEMQSRRAAVAREQTERAAREKAEARAAELEAAYREALQSVGSLARERDAARAEAAAFDVLARQHYERGNAHCETVAAVICALDDREVPPHLTAASQHPRVQQVRALRDERDAAVARAAAAARELEEAEERHERDTMARIAKDHEFLHAAAAKAEARAAAAEAAAGAMRSVLSEVWAGPETAPYCPVCFNDLDRKLAGHADDCELAAALRVDAGAMLLERHRAEVERLVGERDEAIERAAADELELSERLARANAEIADLNGLLKRGIDFVEADMGARAECDSLKAERNRIHDAIRTHLSHVDDLGTGDDVVMLTEAEKLIDGMRGKVRRWEADVERLKKERDAARAEAVVREHRRPQHYERGNAHCETVAAVICALDDREVPPHLTAASQHPRVQQVRALRDERDAAVARAAAAARELEEAEERHERDTMARIAKDHEFLHAKAAAAEERASRLAAALSFYADEVNYRRAPSDMADGPLYGERPVLSDGGRAARAALAADPHAATRCQYVPDPIEAGGKGEQCSLPTGHEGEHVTAAEAAAPSPSEVVEEVRALLAGYRTRMLCEHGAIFDALTHMANASDIARVDATLARLDGLVAATPCPECGHTGKMCEGCAEVECNAEAAKVATAWREKVADAEARGYERATRDVVAWLRRADLECPPHNFTSCMRCAIRAEAADIERGEHRGAAGGEAGR